jgi:hypothetical protein
VLRVRHAGEDQVSQRLKSIISWLLLLSRENKLQSREKLHMNTSAKGLALEQPPASGRQTTCSGQRPSPTTALIIHDAGDARAQGCQVEDATSWDNCSSQGGGQTHHPSKEKGCTHMFLGISLCFLFCMGVFTNLFDIYFYCWGSQSLVLSKKIRTNSIRKVEQTSASHKRIAVSEMW